MGDVDQVEQRPQDDDISTVLGVLSHALCDNPQYDPYTKLSVLMNIANVLLYIFDYVMDIMVVYWLHQEEKADDQVWTWVVLTLVLIFVPLVVVNVFSIVWYHEDHTVNIVLFFLFLIFNCKKQLKHFRRLVTVSLTHVTMMKMICGSQ